MTSALNCIKSIICCSLFVLGSLNAQPYLTPTFQNVEVQTDVVYAKNYTVLSIPITGSTSLRTLEMDIYLPSDNTDSDRPLVLLVGDSGFLPQEVNRTVFGSRTDSVNVELARRLTQLDYLVAVADHRKGWNPTSSEVLVRFTTSMEALYRSQQDVRAAIRFFRKSVAESGNPYGICGDRIILWGIGSGGYATLAAGYLDRFSDFWFLIS